MSTPQSRRWIPAALTIVGVLVVGVALVIFVMNWLGSAPKPQKQVAQEVRIIRPPPPPPDVKPPPPPPPEEEVDVPEAMPEPDAPSDEPPPGEQLGIDAEGTAGGDGFGLVGRKGGRDLLAGGGGSAFAWYAGLLKGEILEQLQAEKLARSGAYNVRVQAWVATDGTIENIRLSQSTGNADRDRAIESALSRIKRLSQAPPAGLPQPVSVRLVSRV